MIIESQDGGALINFDNIKCLCVEQDCEYGIIFADDIQLGFYNFDECEKIIKDIIDFKCRSELFDKSYLKENFKEDIPSIKNEAVVAYKKNKVFYMPR